MNWPTVLNFANGVRCSGTYFRAYLLCNGGPTQRESPVQPNSKVILPYEPGYTGHWEMEKRRKETREWLREREQRMRNRIKAPSIVPQSEPFVGTEKNRIR
jgi:hypothetical protein